MSYSGWAQAETKIPGFARNDKAIFEKFIRQKTGTCGRVDARRPHSNCRFPMA